MADEDRGGRLGQKGVKESRKRKKETKEGRWGRKRVEEERRSGKIQKRA